MSNGPDFLCIGAQKAGTTWVYDNIRFHPDVWVPPSPLKELHYFDNKVPHKELLSIGRYSHGGLIKRYSPLLYNPSWEVFRWLWRFNHHANDSMHWYRSLFTKPGKVSGDITPEYSTLDDRGVEYAKKVVGDKCKVFIILRDPVSRSWSAIKMLYRNYKGSDVNAEAVSPLITNMQLRYSVLRSDYSRMITTWKHHFGEENFAVFFYDDLVKDPVVFLENICRYIGVSERSWVSPVLNKRSNSDNKNIEMPEQAKVEMYRFFLPEIEKLSVMVGGPSLKWLEKAKSVVEKHSNQSK